MPTYQPLIPTGTVNLDIDYQNIQGNFQQLDTVYGIDHLPFSNATLQQGYHKAIHLLTVVNPPTAVPTTAQLYSSSDNDGVSTDTSLWYQTGTAKALRLTRNFLPVAATNGYTFLPGGLILQWGIRNSVSTDSTVTFATSNINFPTACFSVQATATYKPLDIPNGTASVAVKKFTTTNFTFSFQTNSSAYTGFYWVAIGI